MVGVIVPTQTEPGRINAARIAGRLSLPGLPAPERVRRAKYEAHYFILSKQPLCSASELPDIEPDAIAEMLVQLRRQSEEILAVRKDG